MEKNGRKAQKWVNSQNERTIKSYGGDKDFEKVYGEILKKENNEDRLFEGEIRGDYYYQCYSDKDHSLGLWRRTKLSAYFAQQEEWETLLDLDDLSKKENTRYKLQSVSCLRPSNERCLLKLSISGADASVVREFDLKKKALVETGFNILKPFKHDFHWRDLNSILVTSDFGAGSISKANYGLQVRLWKRGESLERSKLVYSAKQDAVGVFFDNKNIVPGEPIILGDYSDFRQKTYRVFRDGSFDTKIDLPSNAEIVAIFKNKIIAKLLGPWLNGNEEIVDGSLIGLTLKSGTNNSIVSVILRPGNHEVVRSVVASGEKLWVHLLKDLKNSLVAMDFEDGQWRTQKYVIDSDGTFYLDSVSSDRDSFFIYEENFLSPKKQFYVESFRRAPALVRASPDTFRSVGKITTLEWARSRDGTRVPYYLIRSSAFEFDGKNPTLIFGYGAADDMNLPWYLGNVGKAWIEKGGVFINAILRGGGELGPSWRTSGYKHDKQHTFDDLIAIAEDLVEKKVTSPRKLGIYGTSWGGLLVSASFIQRPELFGAVGALMPMEDMLNFTLLPIGESWTGEFGDPRNETDYKVLSAYSPYHHVSKDIAYPPILFVSSTNDDRMHTAHARRMAAKMIDQKHDAYYFETDEGGHGGSSTNEAFAKRWATIFRFFQKTLGLEQ
ncbi:MAG: S9 family peptidase [Bdellovibrionaceae bacterium]|nr:S9 family peptidase [Pseudobdellovibrionaceae bacterium]